MPSITRIDASQPNKWHSVFQSAKVVLVTSFENLDFQRCAQDRFLVKHKTKRIAISSNLLACFEVVGETLSQIVTADETWAYCFELETKMHSIEWYCTILNLPWKKFKKYPEGHNHCLLGLWRSDSSGCDTKRKDNKLQNLHQDSDRTQEAFQPSTASQKSNRNLASAWQCKAALRFEDMGSHHKVWLEGAAPT
jgi:predicted metalloenzyme YecM